MIIEGEAGGWPGENGSAVPLEKQTMATSAGVSLTSGPGTRYRYQLDGGDSFPDPASRFQPEDPMVPRRLSIRGASPGPTTSGGACSSPGQVIYEMHVGTFTLEGTWQAAARELAELKELGITCIEVMPVAEFPGRFGWGYDGVDLFAPYAPLRHA